MRPKWPLLGGCFATQSRRLSGTAAGLSVAVQRPLAGLDANDEGNRQPAGTSSGGIRKRRESRRALKAGTPAALAVCAEGLSFDGDDAELVVPQGGDPSPAA